MKTGAQITVFMSEGAVLDLFIPGAVGVGRAGCPVPAPTRVSFLQVLFSTVARRSQWQRRSILCRKRPLARVIDVEVAARAIDLQAAALPEPDDLDVDLD